MFVVSREVLGRRRVVAVSTVGGMVPALPLAATGGSPTLTVVLAVLGSTATATALGAWSRRRTGEGPAAAADDVSAAASRVVAAGEVLTLPLHRRIVELTEAMADLTKRYADARIEVHQAVSESAALKARVAALEYELEATRIRLGEQPGRRSGDPS